MLPSGRLGSCGGCNRDKALTSKTPVLLLWMVDERDGGLGCYKMCAGCDLE